MHRELKIDVPFNIDGAAARKVRRHPPQLDADVGVIGIVHEPEREPPTELPAKATPPNVGVARDDRLNSNAKALPEQPSELFRDLRALGLLKEGVPPVNRDHDVGRGQVGLEPPLLGDCRCTDLGELTPPVGDDARQLVDNARRLFGVVVRKPPAVRKPRQRPQSGTAEVQEIQVKFRRRESVGERRDNRPQRCRPTASLTSSDPDMLGGEFEQQRRMHLLIGIVEQPNDNCWAVRLGRRSNVITGGSGFVQGTGAAV